MGKPRGRHRFAPTLALALALVAWLAAGPSARPDGPLPGDDQTFRPTVMVHKGASLGSGTVIASVEDETLILTACHVVDGPGPLTVDLNRFNLGLERARDATTYPRRLKATVAARDRSVDLAIVRVNGLLALPYVARLARGDAPPAVGSTVTSIGFDQGQKLIGMTTKVRKVERLDLAHGGGERSFLVTESPPEHGRSGGGLFRADGALVGVCIARAQFERGETTGLFSTLGNVKGLLRAHEDLAVAVARSATRPRSPER